MFNLEEYVKKTLTELYDKKVYIGAKVRELALNYLVKGLISQETIIYLDEYITKAETIVEKNEEQEAVEIIEEGERAEQDMVEIIAEEPETLPQENLIEAPEESGGESK